jgi:predicted metal-dependent enzyme (double-stranded beta helix superfamily)
MEIWPVGHFSPIHNHGAATAIIRVLHGNINVSLFPFLCEDKKGVEPFLITNINVGDITWISPTLNQVHQLKNPEKNKDTCITIQCYMYDNENTTHYDYFDYVGANGKIQQFEPDSDMDFIQFKETIRKEWQDLQSTLVFTPANI